MVYRHFYTFLSVLSLLFSNNCFTSIPDEITLSKEDELVIIDGLINRTHKQLEMQKSLKDLMIQYKVQKEIFTQGNHSKPHAFEMVKTARKILDTLDVEKMKHLFPSDYLEELALFSSIANKNRPARS